MHVKSAKNPCNVHILFTNFYIDLHKTADRRKRISVTFPLCKPGKTGYTNIIPHRKEADSVMMENKFIGLDVDDLIFGKDERENSQR